MVVLDTASLGDALSVPRFAASWLVVMALLSLSQPHDCSHRLLALVVAVVLMRVSGTYPRHCWASRLVGVVVR